MKFAWLVLLALVAGVTDGRSIDIAFTVWVLRGGGKTVLVDAVVIASDNAVDAESNLRAQTRMLGLAASPALVVPGHDPAVFERFPLPGKGVARIDR